jgi:hypothetical protein
MSTITRVIVAVAVQFLVWSFLRFQLQMDNVVAVFAGLVANLATSILLSYLPLPERK